MASKYIQKYYEISDPLRRLKYLEKSIELGEEPEENAIRKELWEIRYSKKAAHDKNQRADGFMALWMQMEFLKTNLGGFFGIRGAKKEINKALKNLKFEDFLARGEMEADLLYAEILQLVRSYCELCETDKNYTTYMGLIRMSEASAENKMLNDLKTTGIEFPKNVEMEKELALFVRATTAVLNEKDVDRMLHEDEDIDDLD